MTEIGIVEVSYNRNTETLYGSFKSSIISKKKADVKDKQCTKDFVDQKVKELLGDWFNQIAKIEEADISVNPFVTEVIDEKSYKDGTMKSKVIKVYQK